MTGTRTPGTQRGRTAASLVAMIVVATGCTEGGAVTVDTRTDRPFVLEGVSGLKQVAQLTGPDAINDTVSVGVVGTDLGSMVNFGGKTFFLFGDTYGIREADAWGGMGDLWRSNVSAWTTDDDPRDGITFDAWTPVDEFGLAAALSEGDHAANTGTGEVTKIPTHGFAVDETLYVQYMSVSFWGESGVWDANYAGLLRSTDEGESWENLEDVRWPGDSGFIQVAALPVSENDVDYVYLWGIPSGRFGGVSLMRVEAKPEAVEDLEAYEYFAGTRNSGEPVWDADLAAAQIVVDAPVGELSVMWSTYLGRWIMTYSDAGTAYIREGITPWGPWNDAIQLAVPRDYPVLYSPYMNPRYTTDDGRTIYFTMSLWGPYNVFWFSVDLDKKL